MLVTSEHVVNAVDPLGPFKKYNACEYVYTCAEGNQKAAWLSQTLNVDPFPPSVLKTKVLVFI